MAKRMVDGGPNTDAESVRPEVDSIRTNEVINDRDGAHQQPKSGPKSEEPQLEGSEDTRQATLTGSSTTIT